MLLLVKVLIFGSWERFDYLNFYHLRITFFWSWIRKLDTLPYIFILYIFQKFYCLKKLQNTVSTKMFCICKILLTCNIWKFLCWTHFYNLVASFRRVHWQKMFVMLSTFWPLRRCGGGGLSEYNETCDENVAVAI